MATVSDRVVETLARLHRFAESRPDSGGSELPPVTVALNRQAGSRGAEIARSLGERLGWPVYDHELLARIAEEEGLPPHLLEPLDERRVGWLEEIIGTFSSSHAPAESGYFVRLMKLINALGRAGHCVIVGRGAAHVLPLASTLRVRIVAPREDRLAEIHKRKGMTTAEAGRWVDQTDRERAAYIRDRFRADVNDPVSYDLVLNSTRLGVAGCVDLIAAAVREMEVGLRARARPTAALA